MNNFIVSAKGFLVAITYDLEKNKHVLEWSQSIRNAQKFKSIPKANKLMEKFNIHGFVWNPYKEEPIKGKWEIYQRREYNVFDHTKHTVLEWIPDRVIMEKFTDANYIATKGINTKIYYDSYEDAVEACRIKNQEMLTELQNKIALMEQSILK